jgi:hypothetical protein
MWARVSAGSVSTRWTRSRSAASAFRPLPLLSSSLATSAFSHSRVVVSLSPPGWPPPAAPAATAALSLRHELLLVGLPRVEGEQAPFVGRQRPAGLGVREHRLHGPAAAEPEVHQREHLAAHRPRPAGA